MINLRYQHKLLFCSLNLTIDNQLLHLENVLLDTGSATTLINSDYIHFDGNEELVNVHGVGGYESVLMKPFRSISINDSTVHDVLLCVGEMDYGIHIDLLIGLDLLKTLNADISIKNMCLEFSNY
ncbi:aspartyl protease family protein [Clostridium butyricum]|uniref:Peptidase A2 domain-containing protein n=1 Tax=Clostridium butyricum TaxID=1492 RepID=A0A2S7FDC1_CLOBU|nr:aspartyl protease family protein [Clostridium butyricum]PPV16041.1 hypothetical protein AWN73_10865 [Clostridium butyricum]